MMIPFLRFRFLRNSSGNVGYVTGGAVSATDGVTNHVWGAINGGMRLNAFYPTRLTVATSERTIQ